MMTAAISCSRAIRYAAATVIATTSAARCCMTAGPGAGSLARVNADDVERLVVEVLARELSRPELLTDGVGQGGVETHTRCATTSRGWSLHPARFGNSPPAAATSAAGDPPPTKTATRRQRVAPLPAAPDLVPEKRSLFRVDEEFPTAPSKSGPHFRDRPRQVIGSRDLRSGRNVDTMEIARRSRFSDAHVRRICGSAIWRPTSSRPLLRDASLVP